MTKNFYGEGGLEPVVELVRQIAGSDLPILILGETGVGKERIAELVHASSPRAKGPMLRLNCAELSETLIESELFGHERGAFTGAQATKPGLLETASGGTVLLDEVGELPLSTQTKLLRVIEDREVFRVGSLKPRAIDVRFVAATNRTLDAEIAAGTFRRDLYFRLEGLTVQVPPLRERLDDLEAMATLFLAEAAARAQRQAPRLSATALDTLRRYPWPGNVRELKNMMERAVLMCRGAEVQLEHLPLEKLRKHAVAPAPASAPRPDSTPVMTSRMSRAEYDASLKTLEKRRIEFALQKTAGNQSAAARLLGMSRRTLLNRLDELGFPRPRRR